MPDTKDYRRKILICVAGLSPQIITESIYTLAVHQSWIPDELYVITTNDGAEQVKNSLLPEGRGWLPRLITEYDLTDIAFYEDHILVIEGENNQPLDDIRSVKENDYAGDYITEVIKRFTNCNDKTELHVSIAGGRKTMGFYLGYALSLYGRKQDKLSHVLVNAPFENSRDFFYPRKETDVISVYINRKEQFKDASLAEVTLAEIPFVRLRHLQQKDIVEHQYGYLDAVKQAQWELEEAPKLSINLKHRTIMVNDGISHKMTPRDLSFLTMFARRQINNKARLSAPNAIGDESLANDFLYEFELITGNSIEIDKQLQTTFGQPPRMRSDYFSPTLTKLRKALEKKLGAGNAKPYLIDDGGTRPKTYELAINKENIRIIEDRHYKRD